NEGADTRRSDPPPGAQAVCITQPRRADRRARADVRRQKRCAQESWTETAPGDQKIIGLLHPPRDQKSDADKQCGVNNENRELEIHFPFEKKIMCCQGRNSSER